MNDLFLIASGAGLHDGLNPCVFMACAVFIAYVHFIRKSILSKTSLWLVFCLSYAAGALLFNFTPLQVIALNKIFLLISKLIYFVLGVGSFVLGILFFKDWLILVRSSESRDLLSQTTPFSTIGFVDYLTLFFLGLIFSAMSTLWPIDKYIFILGNVTMIRGQSQNVISLLLLYVLISLWGLWFVWSFFSIGKLRKSLFKLFCSTVYFTASLCSIFFFK